MKHYDTWARLINTREDVPSTFDEFFNAVTANEAAFPYTIFAPSDRWGRRKTIPKLICLLSDRIAICEKHGKELKTVCVPFNDIICLETGTVLLYSWIKIAAETSEGPVTTSIEFNSVVRDYFEPIIELIRFSCSGIERVAPGETVDTEREKFNIYAKNHYKFMNYAKKSILPGENVLEQVLQPDVIVKYMKYFKRLAVTTHLTILTNRELIVIRDTDGLRYKNQARYGGIWSFIPLTKICDVSLKERLAEENSRKRAEDELLTLNVALADKNSVNFRFEPLKRSELERLIHKVKSKEYGFDRACG